MTKQVQRRRGTATQHTSFTGAEGEVSVNTTNKSVHVHDGVTAGGIEGARADLTNVSDSDLNARLTGNTLSSLTITSADINGGTIDGTVIGGSTPAAGNFTTGSFTGNATFGDNDKAIFGAGSDLQIYHDGFNNYIDGVSGAIFVRGSRVDIRGENNELMLVGNQNGSLISYYDNAPKLATTATGIDVTGTVTADGLTVDGGATLHGNGNAPLGWGDTTDVGFLSFDGSGNAIVRSATGARLNFQVNSNRDVLSLQNGSTIFNEGGLDQDFRVESDGNTHMLFVDAGNNHVNIGTSSDLNGVLGVNGLAVSDGVSNGFRVVRGSAAYYGQMSVNYEDSKVNTYIDSIASTAFESQIIFRTSNSSSVTSQRLRLSEATGATFNVGGGDYDFRVESDGNTHMLFVDASSNKVGIGSSSPQTILEILDSSPILRIEDSATGSKRIEIGVGPDAVAFVNAPQSAQTLKNSVTGTESLTQYHNANGVVVNEGGADRDFRVESDSNANMLFVDAGNSRVNIAGLPANFVPNNTKGFVVGTGNGDGNTYSSGSQEKTAVFLPTASGNGSDAGISIGGAAYGTAGTETLRLQFLNTHGSTGRGVGFDIVSNVNLDPNDYNQELRFERTSRSASGEPGRTNQLALQYAATVFNEVGSNIDFRVESDTNTHALFVDASENRVFAGGLSSGSVGSAQFIVNAGEIGTSVGDTLRLQQWYYGTGNGSFFGHKARRTSANGVWTGVVVDTVLEVDNSPDLYNYITYGIGSLVFNDSGSDMDFRVESAVNGTQFFIDGQYGFISIGKSTSAAGTNGLHFGSAGTSAIISASGTGNTWHTYSTSTNSYNFIVGANGTVSYVSLNQLSDEREKENIVDIPVGLEAVKQLRPCQFDWKAAEQGTNVYGFIAQEVESVIPTIVSEYKKSDTETRKSIKHVDLIAVLTKAMQEQQAMIETLEARIAALETP